ncbi:MAG: hypothetical protein LC808_15410, partial [Actinobacteria bacterium]|nr:hypothetical protein [Actinomycetota bacterium]
LLGRAIAADLPAGDHRAAYVLLEVAQGVAEGGENTQQRTEALPVFEEALSAARDCTDTFERHNAEGGILNAMARLHHRIAKGPSDFQRSKSTFWQALRAFRRLDTESSWRIAMTLSNLAVVETETGCYRRADMLLQRAYTLDAGTEAGGEMNKRLAYRAHNLAYNWLTWGKATAGSLAEADRSKLLDSAAKYSLEGLERRRRVYGTGRRSSSDYAASLRLLGQVRHAQGRLTRAHALFCCAQEIMTQARGSATHDEVGVILGLRAEVLLDDGQVGAARQAAEAAADIARTVHGADSPRFLDARSRLGRISNDAVD